MKNAIRFFSIIAFLAWLAPVSVVHAEQTATEVKNKEIVLDFYEKAINEKNFDAASKYLGPHYIQHNQHASDGAAGLRKFIEFLRDKFPGARSEIKRVLTDGDYVILHVHAVRVPGTRGSAVVDIFRLEHGKIVEHWDVHEEIINEPANGNGMF